jgi:hypothetical protein
MALIRSTPLALLIAALLAACGGSAATSTTTATSTTPTASATPATSTTVTASAAANPRAFSWLRPAPAPPGWTLARLTGTTALAYPSSWHLIHSDPGTVSAARDEPGSDIVAGYLNVTPQQGEETFQNWASFRPDHNREEGDSQEHVLAAARDLRFRDGQGSCVIDRYRTPKATYQEIACLVRGPHGANVIVAAAPAGRWAQAAPALERAVSAFLA